MAEECSSKATCSRESCEGCPSAAGAGQQEQGFEAPMNSQSHVAHVIGVVSGKGGVGKSMVTASLANRLAAEGFRVGILDADITGPSIPRMYGLEGLAQMNDTGILPRVTENGIKVISLNLLVENPEEPVIWRGPILAGLVKQFWSDVIWGELDFLLVDMPPGTGDVPLTVFQSLPVEGIFVVTSPQDLVRMIVKKAYHMAGMMNIPVLGLIENYSYMICPDCGKKLYMFGQSKIEAVAGEMGVSDFDCMPVDPALAQLTDSGDFAKAENPYVNASVQRLKAMASK